MPRQRAKERACDEAIKKTLAYSSIFKYPLSLYQLYYFLIADRKFEKKFFEKSLKRLLKSKKVRVKSNTYYLSGVKPVSWKLRNKYTKRILKRNKKELDMLAMIPWVKMIGITGSVAANNAEKKADTDILVITNKNRVWITRGFLIVLLILMGKYPNRESKKLKICPNIYIPEDNLMWPKEKQNIYTAREVMMLQPYFDKEAGSGNDPAYFRFMKANEWAFKYFPNIEMDLPKRYKNSEGNPVLNFLENLARVMEIKYMNVITKEITGEKLNKNFIHFNKHDKSRNILKEFSKLTKKKMIK